MAHRMAKNRSLSQFPPLVFNVFKPARLTSYDVVRHFKRHLPSGFGKIGHFGTLDPFACGVMLIGIGGAARLNDYVHEFLPKTYLAVGKLGIETPTGDWQSEISQRDDSAYLKDHIGSFSVAFIQDCLQKKFLGDYWQSPHQYSAAKFMGKNLHEWAREGIEIKKDQVLRTVHHIEVVKYKFPYLSVRVTVSSGTYVRTLFNHMAQELGTIGSLISLVRESIGPAQHNNSLRMKEWPKDREMHIIDKGLRIDQLLPFGEALLSEQQVGAFKNGAFLKAKDLNLKESLKIKSPYIWMKNDSDQLLGLATKIDSHEIRPKINFHSEAQAES
jgi:tRNA pseudouridine55 synthase